MYRSYRNGHLHYTTPTFRLVINGANCLLYYRRHCQGAASGDVLIDEFTLHFDPGDRAAVAHAIYEHAYQTPHEEPDMPSTRHTDPDTSHEAAASIRVRTSKQRAVLAILRRFGPMTDVSLQEAYRSAESAHLPQQSDSGLRTRRRELADLGLVIDTGHRTRLPSGRHAIVWSAA